MLLARRQDVAALPKLDRLRVGAIDLTITRDFAAAAAKYEEMANAGAPDAELAVDLGRAYANAEQRDKAIANYRRAAKGAAHNPAAWLQLAILYSRARDTAKADEAFRQAEERYQLTSNLEGLIEVAFQRGAAADTLDEFEAGAKHLHKALETAQFVGNVQQEVRAKLELGTNAYQVGDAATAERYAREGLDTAPGQQNRQPGNSRLGRAGLGIFAQARFRRGRAVLSAGCVAGASDGIEAVGGVRVTFVGVAARPEAPVQSCGLGGR